MTAKYEVVISGMAGKFPGSDTIEEFGQNLMNKTDVITKEENWKLDGPLAGVPSYVGKLLDKEELDMTFFGLHRRLCQVTDPHHRLCLELTFSAIIDAGCNPADLWGSNTAVLASSVTSETEYECLMDLKNIGISILGHSRSMQGNRISFSYNFTGPSLTIDSSWNGCMQGLCYASEMISRGAVTSAVVTSCSLIYTGEAAYHHYRMGRLTANNETRCFSNNADGYNRSEGCVAFFLQRKEDSLRSYGSPLIMPAWFSGSKLDPFSETSKENFKGILEKFYKENNIDPESIGFIEAAGVASKAIDAAELNVLGELLTNKRKRPLLVGSVKSNIGHTEAAASGAAIAKALYAANTGIIPPNLHYYAPNDMVPYLSSGEIKVVTDPTPLVGDLIGVSSFSTVGGFAHLLIKRHNKEKNRKPEKYVLPPDGLPRLFILSGRNEEGINRILRKVEGRPIDEEYIALANHAFKKGIKKHLYRGYTVINDKKREFRNTKAFFTGGQKIQPVWFVFTGMGSQWPQMGVQLMKIPIFSKAINHCHEVLKQKGIDLINIITTPNPEIFDNILHSFVGIAAIQIGLVDILTELGIKPDGIIGHSVGELGCGYADGCVTAEQMILAAYARGKASIETDLIQGLMAAVGCGYKVMANEVPNGIEIACHNSADSCTLSGPKKLMEEYVATLKKRGVFAKLVNVANIAYHSTYIRPAAPALLRYLKEVIPNPQPRSAKWISTSVPECEWDKDSAKYCSADYYTNNLLGSVLFEEASKHIPQDAVIIEIAPHGLLQAILKRAFPAAQHVPLTNRSESDGLLYLVNALGKLYLEGLEMDIERLYPPVTFPVSSGTPSLDDLVVWDHSEKWKINIVNSIEDYDIESDALIVKSRVLKLNSFADQLNHLEDYTIYGCSVVPLSHFLELVINDYQLLHKLVGKPLILTDIRFKRHLELAGDVDLYVSLGKGSGYWEICKDDYEIVTGEIDFLLFGPKTTASQSLGVEVLSEDLYNYFTHMGHHVGLPFRLIKSVSLSSLEVSAVVEWNGNLVTFLDAILKIPVLLTIGRNQLHLVSEIKQLIIDFSKFQKHEFKEVVVYYNSQTGVLTCEGLQMLYPKTSLPIVTLEQDKKTVLWQELEFLPYEFPLIKCKKELIELSINILIDQMDDSSTSPKILTLIEMQEKVDLHDICEVLRWISDMKVQIKSVAADRDLDCYSSDSNSEYCLILSGSTDVDNCLNVISQSRRGFILFEGNHITLPPSLSVIFSRHVEGKKYTLCSLFRPLKEDLKYVTTGSSDWKDLLQRKLTETKNEIVFLIGKITSLPCINIITNECNKLPNGHLLRYIFIDSDINPFQNKEIREHLQKDLRVNILKDKIWGTCLRQTRNIDIDRRAAAKAVYEFSDLRIEGGMKLKALGLNFKDITSTNSNLGVFEYSGELITDDGHTKYNKNYKKLTVCGIGRLSKKTCKLEADPIFSWKKPEELSHEDAASVLISYAMAYHIIMKADFSYIQYEIERILVHRGSLPLSQAVINIAESLGMEIYTTYESEEEKKLIMQIFPELPESNIISCRSQFDSIILEKTKGKGVKIVINTLAESKFVKPSLGCLGNESVMYQISRNVFQECQTIGMLVFLKKNLVVGLSPDNLLNLKDHEKLAIKSAIEKGFENGIIKPFSTLILPSNVTNTSAISILRSNLDSDKKAVVSFDYKLSGLESKSYLCNMEDVYVVLGTEHGFWVDLVEWLLKKRAKYVHILTSDDRLKGFAVEKLQFLLLENPNFKCIFTPINEVGKDTKAVEDYIERINKNGTLDTIFIIGQANKIVTEALLQVAKKEKVIVMSENAPAICEERIRNGLPTVALSVPSHLLTPYQLLPRLDTLLCSDLQIAFISEKFINKNLEIDIERSAIYVHLPNSVEEILEFGRGSSKGYWKETKSCSPHWKSCPELPPVFVILPLKRGQMDPLIQSIFHPTFTAVLPKSFIDFEEIAYHLYQDFTRFNTDIFTIICSDWSWPVGIILGKLLEKDGKIISLIFFECCISFESEVALQQITNVVKSYSYNSSCKTQENENYSLKLEKSLSKLKYLFNLCGTKLPSKSPKIKGICHYIRSNEQYKKERTAKIQEYCEQTINVYTSEEIDYLNMMKNKKLQNHINSCIAFGYKDAATKIERMYMKDSIYNNPRLSFLSFMQSLHVNKCW